MRIRKYTLKAPINLTDFDKRDIKINCMYYTFWLYNDWTITCRLSQKKSNYEKEVWWLPIIFGSFGLFLDYTYTSHRFTSTLNFTLWTHEWTLFMNILHVCDIPPVKVSHRCLQLCGQPLVSDNPSRNNSHICTLSPDCCVCWFSPGNEDKSLLSEGNFHFR